MSIKLVMLIIKTCEAGLVLSVTRIWGSYALIVAPMGPLLPAKFYSISATCRPCGQCRIKVGAVDAAALGPFKK